MFRLNYLILFFILIPFHSFGATSYNLAAGATITVGEFSVCKNLTNASAVNYIVPTGIAGDWSAFLAHLPGGVTFSDCSLCYKNMSYSSWVADNDANVDSMLYEVAPEAPSSYRVTGYSYVSGGGGWQGATGYIDMSIIPGGVFASLAAAQTNSGANIPSSCGAYYPIPAVCGTSNGATFTSAPTNNLCSSGTATVVTGAGPWSWHCVGSATGANASCSANLPSASCPATTISNCVLANTPNANTSGGCNTGYTGTCSYSCSNGAWSLVSNTCAPCTDSPISWACSTYAGQFGIPTNATNGTLTGTQNSCSGTVTYTGGCYTLSLTYRTDSWSPADSSDCSIYVRNPTNLAIVASRNFFSQGRTYCSSNASAIALDLCRELMASPTASVDIQPVFGSGATNTLSSLRCRL